MLGGLTSLCLSMTFLVWVQVISLAGDGPFLQIGLTGYLGCWHLTYPQANTAALSLVNFLSFSWTFFFSNISNNTISIISPYTLDNDNVKDEKCEVLPHWCSGRSTIPSLLSKMSALVFPPWHRGPVCHTVCSGSRLESIKNKRLQIGQNSFVQESFLGKI